MAGKNIGVGKDHTLFSRVKGIVKFRSARKINFDGRQVRRHVVDIV
jgi:ribosomal protein L27